MIEHPQHLKTVLDRSSRLPAKFSAVFARQSSVRIGTGSSLTCTALCYHMATHVLIVLGPDKNISRIALARAVSVAGAYSKSVVQQDVTTREKGPRFPSLLESKKG